MTSREIAEMIEEQQIALLSFDIFDTLLTRTCEKPTDVFHLMERAFPEIPKNFPEHRIAAEAKARTLVKGGECNIKEIYDVLAGMDGYSPLLCKRLQLMEEDTELRVCKPRAEGAALLQLSEDLDIPVVLVSDMYLSARHISRMLCKCGATNFSEMYISCEKRCSKATGDLFRYVRKAEAVEYSVMLHVGDNPISDVIVPQNLGMHTLYLPKNPNTEFPKQTGLDRIFPHGTRRRKLAAAVKKQLGHK